MKVAFITTYDARDINAWSGTPYFMAQSLKEHCQSLYYVGSLKTKWNSIFQGKTLLYAHLFNRGYFRDRQPAVLRDYARQVKDRLSQTDADVLFSPGTVPIAYLEDKRHIAFWTDATFAGMVNYYPGWDTLSKETIRDGNAMEQAALSGCSLAIYASDWAARSAVENYNVEPSKVKVVPFGANIECSRTAEDIKTIVDKRPSNKCNLLFIGKDWFRKGGDIAIQVALKLNDNGLPTELTIVGVAPKLERPVPPFVKLVGPLDKSTDEERSLLEQLFTQAHFLILPSRAECFGIVLAEANSFGVPCITSKAGGIPTVIQDGVNGMSFDASSPVENYCAYIEDVFTTYPEYRELALCAFNEYQTRLNWKVAGDRISGMLSALGH